MKTVNKMTSIKQVLETLQIRYAEQDYTTELGETLITWLQSKLGFQIVWEENGMKSRWTGRAKLRMVDYDHVIDENGRVEWEVIVSTLNGKGYMTFCGTRYDVKNKVKSNKEKEEVRTKIAELEEGYDKYVEYIDNGRQYQQAKALNSRIRAEQEKLWNLF